MKRKMKRIVSILLVLTFVFTLTLTNASIVKADTTILHKTNTASAGDPFNYTFSLDRESDLDFSVRTEYQTGIKLEIKDALLGTEIISDTIASTDSDWKYQKKTGVFELQHSMHIAAGNYILEIVFDQDASFDFTMNQRPLTAKLNKTSLSITKGFSDSIKVTGGKIKTCTSSNTKVATVTNKGKISAKANGKATIKVKLTNGKVLTCKVSVKPNIYNAKNITITDTLLNNYQMKAYKASFDKKGNLIIKFKIANNGSGRITTVHNFKITVTDSKKDTVATYKKTNFEADLNSFKDKSYSVTIPKSALKKNVNNIDIRTAKIKITSSDASLQM